MEVWRRRQLHSHSYRLPEPFCDEVVVMVGCGDNGKDIALDLIGVAKEVHLTTKSTEEATMPAMSKLLAKYANLHLRPHFKHLCEDGTLVFVDGSRVVALTAIYCTGYAYSFPFGHGWDGHRRRQPCQAAVRARVRAGAGPVAVVRRRPEEGAGAMVLRGKWVAQV
uniref:Flavin-containing monooxygenase n=1 Tax=Oryza glumipatula TaxID=40148 RepID=A0A0E0B8N7_9ORYZ